MTRADQVLGALHALDAEHGHWPRPVAAVAARAGLSSRATRDTLNGLLADGKVTKRQGSADGERRPVYAVANRRRSRCTQAHQVTEARRGQTYGGNRLGGSDRITWGDHPIEANSRTSLPFFEAQPGEPFDRHYCGCRGWD